MAPINGHGHSPATSRVGDPSKQAPEAANFNVPDGTQHKVKELFEELEVPFSPSVIEWRVTNTSKDKKRGQVIPYADQRAYTDRLNALFTPAGWTRKYTVHSSANFQRSADQRVVAKVFVTCDLTIFGLGCHSATGEEWTDDQNAGTIAEAQAFKRSCSCFGLGRYLYHFTGVWVDLDDRKRPKTTPHLAGWATPEGWRRGQRPQAQVTAAEGGQAGVSAHQNLRREIGRASSAEHLELIHQIESMAEPLGKRLYRGVLRTVARAWKPSDISDTTMLRKVLAAMQAGDRMLDRLHTLLEETGDGPLKTILRSLKLNSLDQVDNLETLEKIVRTLESQ